MFFGKDYLFFWRLDRVQTKGCGPSRAQACFESPNRLKRRP
jgi:hypothetical protein